MIQEKIEPEMLRTAGQFVLQGMMNLALEAKTNLIIDRRWCERLGIDQGEQMTAKEYCKRIQDQSCVACAKCYKGIKEGKGEFASYDDEIELE